MNKATREELSKKVSAIEELLSEVETARDDEQDKYDNMPEGLQSSERGEAMNTAIGALDSAISALEEAKGYLEEAAQ